MIELFEVILYLVIFNVLALLVWTAFITGSVFGWYIWYIMDQPEQQQDSCRYINCVPSKEITLHYMLYITYLDPLLTAFFRT